MTRWTLVARLLAPFFASLLASTSLAAPTLPGINARWDDCYAGGGVMNKTFACNTNTGSESVVLSVQLDTGMSNVSGMEIRVSLKGSTPALPAWWDFFTAGTCRQASLSFVSAPSTVLSPGSCVDWNEGLGGGGGIGAYRVDEIGPGSRVLLIASAVPQSTLALLGPGTEYSVGLLRINHAKTVGTEVCGGCDTPVCILFTSLKITTPVGANDRLFTQGANGAGSQIANWQNGQLENLVNHCTGTFACTTQFDCMAVGAVASRHSTWGAVKSLYR